MRKFFLLFGFSVVLTIPTTLHAFGIEIAGGAWYQSPQGNFSVDKSTDADDLDLEDDLNYDDRWKPSGRLKIDMPSFFPNIYLMYTPMKWAETGRKNVNFKFGDETFNAQVDFDSEVEMNHLDTALYYGLPFIKTATSDILNIDLGFNLRLMDFKSEIDQEANGLKESIDYLLPIPMVYGGIQIKPFQYIAIEFEGRGIAYSANYYVSLIGRLKGKPFGPFFAAAGFRYDHVDIESQDVEIDAEFSGPFVEIGLEF